MNLTESDQKYAQMIPNYVQIDMVLVTIKKGNHTISLNYYRLGNLSFHSSLHVHVKTIVQSTKHFSPNSDVGLECTLFLKGKEAENAAEPSLINAGGTT